MDRVWERSCSPAEGKSKGKSRVRKESVKEEPRHSFGNSRWGRIGGRIGKDKSR